MLKQKKKISTKKILVGCGLTHFKVLSSVPPHTHKEREGERQRERDRDRDRETKREWEWLKAFELSKPVPMTNLLQQGLSSPSKTVLQVRTKYAIP